MKLVFFLVTIGLIINPVLSFYEPSTFSPGHDEIFRRSGSRNEEPAMKIKAEKQDAEDVKEQGYIKAFINAGRYDWFIRKPGSFAAEPLIIDIESNRAITLTFSEFDDLKSKTCNQPKIAAFYGFGATLAETERNGWIPAANLNHYHQTLTPDPAGTGHLLLKIWPKIDITRATPAGEYIDTGYLTFTVLENQKFVDNDL